jgi:hypothetical protein
MVPVRLAGAEVSEAFWASAAVLSWPRSATQALFSPNLSQTLHRCGIYSNLPVNALNCHSQSNKNWTCAMGPICSQSTVTKTAGQVSW